MRQLITLLLSVCCLVLGAAPVVEARTLFTIDLAEVGGAMGAETVVMSHLPSWVQVVRASAPLYASDSGTQPGPRPGQYTFLRVLGGGASRLQVDAYDEYGNTLGWRGWVEPGDVLPSAPGIDWFVASKYTTLWRGADDTAEPIRGLDAFTPLQLLDGPVQNRLKVRVYRGDFSMLDQGWVDLADTGPALAPKMWVPSPTPDRLPGARTQSTSNQQQSFLDAVAPGARAAAWQTGVPASVTVAQAILESDWGRSLLAQNANNYFGIKAMGTLGSDGVVWMPTSEYDTAGQLYETMSAFRAYKSLTDSLADHDRLLQTAPRYAIAMQATQDPKQFAARLYEAGYSTDPAYADKLVSLMDRYGLYSLDG